MGKVLVCPICQASDWDFNPLYYTHTCKKCGNTFRDSALTFAEEKEAP